MEQKVKKLKWKIYKRDNSINSLGIVWAIDEESAIAEFISQNPQFKPEELDPWEI